MVKIFAIQGMNTPSITVLTNKFDVRKTHVLLKSLKCLSLIMASRIETTTCKVADY